MEQLRRTYSRRDPAMSIPAAGAAGLVAVQAADAAQPHMQAALTALKNANNQLQNAEEDKAGHRAKAIQLVGQAMSQVQQGIQAGK